MPVAVAPDASALPRGKGFPGKQPCDSPSVKILQRLGCFIPPWSRTVVAEQDLPASDGWDPRWQLQRSSRRKR